MATYGERNKLFGWATSDVGDREYLSSITSVGAQAAAYQHIANCETSVSSEHQAFHRRYQKGMADFVKGPTAIKLLQELSELRARGAVPNAI